MIVVTVELHSAVTGQTTTLGKAIIANDGQGSLTHGNYDMRVGRKGQTDLKDIWSHPQRTAKIANFPRLRKNVWYLLRCCLAGAGY